MVGALIMIQVFGMGVDLVKALADTAAAYATWCAATSRR
jgi:hypothetical protein